MSTYSENLHSNIVNSLQTQQLHQKKLSSKLNASMFTLYYAQGAVITAFDNFTSANETLVDKSAVMDQAVQSANLCTNQLASATQAQTYLKKAVTNASVAAANVQIASSAILKLASDTGSIFNIISAADFGTNISNYADLAQSYMSQTALEAEHASKLAMKVTTLTATVSGSTVLDKAKSANTLMTGLLKKTTLEFNDASKNVASDNETMAAARVKEKAAEGKYEDNSVEFNAAISAYILTNKELNLDLNVSVQPAQNITVSFDEITLPFPVDGNSPASTLYPVDSYYIIVVKDQNKSTFSIFNAESLVEEDSNQSLIIKVSPDKDPHGLTGSINKTSQPVTLTGANINATFNSDSLVDSDGEKIVLGEQYVVFVMAMFSKDYKRKLNVFDDFLSAPSASFTITNSLTPATNIAVSNNIVNHSAVGTDTVARTIFLPYSDKTLGLMTDKAFGVLADHLQDVLLNKTPSPAGEPGTKLAADKSIALQFLFNDTLAEHVTAGNYLVPDPTTLTTAITSATTDNFGNVLVEGVQYLPVILTMPKNDNDETVTPSLSDLNSSTPFTYQPK